MPTPDGRRSCSRSARPSASSSAEPSAEAADLVDVLREHGLRSGPVHAAVIAYMLEQHLPRLWGALADSLQKHYGVKAGALEHLRFEAGRAAKVEKWVAAPRRQVRRRAPIPTRCSRRAARRARRSGHGPR